MVLNPRRRQSLCGKHGKGVDGLFEKVSFQTAFEGNDEPQPVCISMWEYTDHRPLKDGH